jgi:hypothetical protein
LFLLHVHENETDEEIAEEFVSEIEHGLAIFGKFFKRSTESLITQK